MREIRFRGKREDNGEWVEGYLVKHFEKCYIYYEEPDEMCQVGSWFCGAEVIPETVGQYTGKELGNEKLFKGDIVETFEDYDDKFGYPTTAQFYSVVVWDEENLCWAFKTGEYIQGFNDWTWGNTMKIGNIHDNPELLKEGDE